jgi:hypothetical protein
MNFLFIYFVFVFLHTNKDKHGNCCYILKVIIVIKYNKTYSSNSILLIEKIILKLRSTMY